MASSASLPHGVLSEDVYLRWATRADISAIAKLFYTFLMDFEMQDHVAPRRAERPEEYHLFALARIRMYFSKPGVRFMVAERVALKITGEEREVIGFSGWDAQGDDNAVRRLWIQEDETWGRALERQLVHLEVLQHRFVRNTILDYAAFETIWKRLVGAYHHLQHLQNNLHLQLLVVAPEWRKGRGIGRRLMQWGIKVADDTGLPIVLEASQAGVPFYLKMGCTVLNTVTIDVVPEKAYEKPIMVYEPKAKKGVGITAA